MSWGERQEQYFEEWWVKNYAPGPFDGMVPVNQAIKQIARESWMASANGNWQGE